MSLFGALATVASPSVAAGSFLASAQLLHFLFAVFLLAGFGFREHRAHATGRECSDKAT